VAVLVVTPPGRMQPAEAAIANVRYHVSSIAKRGGLDVHPHMLRHGCGYALANKGRDTRLIQDYLGHVDIGNTVIYTETAPARFEGLWDNNK